MLGEGKAWTEYGGIRLNESIALALDHRGWDGLALDLLELGLVVEEFELAWSARHEQIDHPLGLDGKAHEIRLARSSEGFLGEQGCEGDLADANSTVLEKNGDGYDEAMDLGSWFGDGFV